MKKYILIFIFVIFCAFDLFAQSGNLELGKRYLKLGGSYRESGEFALSKKYLEEGLALVTKYNDSYWIGVGNEYLGYYWRDKAAIEGNESYFLRALEYLDNALSRYQRLKLRGSSIEAVKKAIANLQSNKYQSVTDNSQTNFADVGMPSTDNEKQLINQAIALLHNHRFQEAEKLLQKGLKLYPDSEFIRYLLYIIPRIEKYPTPGINYEKVNIITSRKELKDDYIDHSRVDIIDLSNSDNLTRIPKELENFPNIQILNLSNNDITKISDNDPICDLKNLRILDLSFNNLSDIPNCIKALPKLQVLYLRGNDIPMAQILKLKDSNPLLQIVLEEDE